jgi:futalosine hydrolase
MASLDDESRMGDRLIAGSSFFQRATKPWLWAYAAPVEGDAIAARMSESLEIGVGKTAAAITLTERLVRGPLPGGVLLFGACGAYPPEHLGGATHGLKTLDLCLVSDDLLADEGVEMSPDFTSIQDLDLGAIGPFSMDAAATDAIARELGGIPRVRGATVSTCSGTDARSLTIAMRSGASVETMEGAAVAMVCRRFNVPLVQLRCVSNFTGDRNRSEWNLEGAVVRIHHALLRLREG